jgi:hypothetical protein
MAFTKRHYEEVARIIRTQRERAQWLRAEYQSEESAKAIDSAARMISEDLRRMFAADNPRFDGTRFDMACEPKGGAK